MIDTDKYEGHTEGPWKWDKWAVLQGGPHMVMWVDFLEPDPDWQLNNSAIHVSEIDEKLIADAPLLLAEVKRLSALADALFDLIPSHLSTEATDIWNEYNGDEEE